MAHLHSIYDCDTHFVIDLKTREIKNDIGKTVIVQNDHNSERFSFELPKEIEGHDMSRCNVVQVHYVNIDAKTKEQHEGSYEVDDLQISPDGDDVVILSWLLSQNATRAVGNLYFGIVFKCIEEDGSLTYSWHTTVNKDFKVVESLENSDVILEEYPDILAQFEARFAALEEEYAEKLNEAVNLTESVNQLKDQASTKQETANALKANASGEIVRIDDVSPVEHTVKVKASGATDPSAVTLYASGKNLFDVNVHKTNPQNCEVLDSTENKYTVKGGEGKGTALAHSTGAFQVRFNKNIKVVDKVTVSAYVTLLELGKYDNRVRVTGRNASGSTILQDDFELEINKRQKISVTYVATRGSIDAVSFYLNNNKVLIEVDTLQVEIGGVATEYESHTEESCKLSADGTAEVLSTSPTMTLFTDTDGVSIDVEYNQNLNDAIEQLKKEAPNGSGSGGSVDVDLTDYVKREEMPDVDIDDVVEKIESSVNLYPAFPVDKWFDDSIQSSSTGITDSVGFCCMPMIEVEPSTQYVVSIGNLFILNAKGGRIDLTVINEQVNGKGAFLFTTPENCDGLLISIHKESYIGTSDINEIVEDFNSTFMLVKGDTLPSEFVPYSETYYKLKDNVRLPDNIKIPESDFVLTEEDKAEIAEKAVEIIDTALLELIG